MSFLDRIAGRYHSKHWEGSGQSGEGGLESDGGRSEVLKWGCWQ